MIVVTGASGQLGRLVVEDLKTLVPETDIVAAARTPARVADLGVQAREADYDRPDTVKAAIDGASKVLLISGTDFGNRVRQHIAVIDAAKEAGASVVYTSGTKADTTQAIVAAEHKATEEYLQESGVTYTIVRNGWYNENYEQAIGNAVQFGALYGAADGGRIASASRSDYAAGAAAVLAGQDHDGQVYEFSGDAAWTLSELAAEISTTLGKQIVYQDLPTADYAALLRSAGLHEPLAQTMADVDANIAKGWLADIPHTLSTLTGRPTQPIASYVHSVLH